MRTEFIRIYDGIKWLAREMELKTGEHWFWIKNFNIRIPTRKNRNSHWNGNFHRFEIHRLGVEMQFFHPKSTRFICDFNASILRLTMRSIQCSWHKTAIGNFRISIFHDKMKSDFGFMRWIDAVERMLASSCWEQRCKRHFVGSFLWFRFECW